MSKIMIRLELTGHNELVIENINFGKASFGQHDRMMGRQVDIVRLFRDIIFDEMLEFPLNYQFLNGILFFFNQIDYSRVKNVFFPFVFFEIWIVDGHFNLWPDWFQSEVFNAPHLIRLFRMSINGSITKRN